MQHISCLHNSSITLQGLDGVGENWKDLFLHPQLLDHRADREYLRQSYDGWITHIVICE